MTFPRTEIVAAWDLFWTRKVPMAALHGDPQLYAQSIQNSAMERRGVSKLAKDNKKLRSGVRAPAPSTWLNDMWVSLADFGQPEQAGFDVSERVPSWRVHTGIVSYLLISLTGRPFRRLTLRLPTGPSHGCDETGFASIPPIGMRSGIGT
jgi:hypothetical protein